MFLIVSLFKLAVSSAYPVDFLLEQLTFVRLLLDCSFHFVYLLLSLSYVVLDLIHLLVKVSHGVFLQINLTPGLFDLILQTFDHHGLSFTTINCNFIMLHLLLLTFAISQLKLEKFLSLMCIQLFTLAKVCNFDQQFLLIHLTLDVIKHRDRYVIDNFELFVDLSQHFK